jgi:hypothetical protein
VYLSLYVSVSLCVCLASLFHLSTCLCVCLLCSCLSDQAQLNELLEQEAAQVWYLQDTSTKCPMQCNRVVRMIL